MALTDRRSADVDHNAWHAMLDHGRVRPDVTHDCDPRSRRYRPCDRDGHPVGLVESAHAECAERSRGPHELAHGRSDSCPIRTWFVALWRGYGDAMTTGLARQIGHLSSMSRATPTGTAVAAREELGVDGSSR